MQVHRDFKSSKIMTILTYSWLVHEYCVPKNPAAVFTPLCNP